jgi:hypothetical protein
MQYFYARFKGYEIAVLAGSQRQAMQQLVKYIRDTKKNILYSEKEIKRDGRTAPIEIIEPVGIVSRLNRIESDIVIEKKDLEKSGIRISKLESRLEEHKRRLREIFEAVEKDEYEDYY